MSSSWTSPLHIIKSEVVFTNDDTDLFVWVATIGSLSTSLQRLRYVQAYTSYHFAHGVVDLNDVVRCFQRLFSDITTFPVYLTSTVIIICPYVEVSVIMHSP